MKEEKRGLQSYLTFFFFLRDLSIFVQSCFPSPTTLPAHSHIPSRSFPLSTTKQLLSFYYSNATAHTSKMGGSFSRLYRVITLFDKKKIVDNFRNMDKIGFPTRLAKRSSKVASFVDKTSEFVLPDSFDYEGQKIQTADYLRDYWVTGLVVLRGTSDPTKGD